MPIQTHDSGRERWTLHTEMYLDRDTKCPHTCMDSGTTWQSEAPECPATLTLRPVWHVHLGRARPGMPWGNHGGLPLTGNWKSRWGLPVAGTFVLCHPGQVSGTVAGCHFPLAGENPSPLQGKCWFPCVGGHHGCLGDRLSCGSSPELHRGAAAWTSQELRGPCRCPAGRSTLGGQGQGQVTL